MEGLDASDVVVANMDGPDPDSGTCWECGYAYEKKPIVVYRTDFRRAGDAGDSAYNLMLTASADEIVDASSDIDDLDAVAAKINAAITKIQQRTVRVYSAPLETDS